MQNVNKREAKKLWRYKFQKEMQMKGLKDDHTKR